jgi:hypothetical protein
MKKFVGCGVFTCILAAGGLIGLKVMGDRAIKEISFRENTAKGVSMRFVKALAEDDLDALRKYAHKDFRDKCPELMEKFDVRVEDIKHYSARFLSDDHRDRIVVGVYVTDNHSYHEVIVWIREIEGTPMVVNCQL